MNSIIEEDLRMIIDRIPYQKLENKVFLITGASGFLASVIVNVLMYLNDHYFSRKSTVIALCRSKEKAERKFGEFLKHSYFKLYVQGVEDKLQIDNNVNYIIHAASRAVTSDFKRVPIDILSANIVGVYNLLKLAYNMKSESFLFFSSGAVYGELPGNINDVEEKDYFPLNYLATENCYAEAKRAGEALCRAYWEQYGVPTKIVRISHTYGPGINLADGRVFSDFVDKICKNQNLVIKGSGNDVRPFCYITDAVVAFFLILLNGGNGEVYNMANNKETVTIRELAETLVNKAFPERNIRIEGKNLTQSMNSGKIKINTDKLMRLGWNPEIDIIEGFRRTVKSFEESVK